MKNEYIDLIKELKTELEFEEKILTRDQCFSSITRHNILYMRAKEILENWHEFTIEELESK